MWHLKAVNCFRLLLDGPPWLTVLLLSRKREEVERWWWRTLG